MRGELRGRAERKIERGRGRGRGRKRGRVGEEERERKRGPTDLTPSFALTSPTNPPSVSPAASSSNLALALQLVSLLLKSVLLAKKAASLGRSTVRLRAAQSRTAGLLGAPDSTWVV